MTTLHPDSPCEVLVRSSDDGGVFVEVFVPTYTGGQKFTIVTERDGDGDWRLYLPAWPEEDQLAPDEDGRRGVTPIPWGREKNGSQAYLEVAGGIVYLGAPDVEVRRR